MPDDGKLIYPGPDLHHFTDHADDEHSEESMKKIIKNKLKQIIINSEKVCTMVDIPMECF